MNIQQRKLGARRVRAVPIGNGKGDVKRYVSSNSKRRPLRGTGNSLLEYAVRLVRAEPSIFVFLPAGRPESANIQARYTQHMGSSSPRPGPDARRGFWTAAIIAVLYLGTMYANPVVGLAYALVFAAAAWGIRHGSAWAATAAALILVAPVVTSLFRATFSRDIGMAQMISATVGVGLLLFAAVLLARAAKELWRGLEFSPWIVFLTLAIAGIVCYRPLILPTGSMEDTILAGDYMLVNTMRRQPLRGSLVVFEYPIDRKNIFVKRVVAVAGDRVHLENKKLFVNGVAADEPYARNKTTIIDYFRDNFPRAPNVRIFAPAEDMLKNHFREGDILVPEGKYFVLGDNRDNSLDSRYWGFIDRGDIIGQPALIYASFNTTGGKRANIFTTRWDRLLRRL